MDDIRRALLSVTDKTGLLELARTLVARRVELVASGGTASHLRQADLPVTLVEELTRFPEILGGRVKTLHPALHAGLLADLGSAQHRADLEEHGLRPIELVIVNFYDFAAASARDELPIEAIDIGGPTLARAAAKNFAWVTVLTHPEDYGAFVAAFAAGRVDLEWRRRAAARAFARVAAYDAAISERFARAAGGEGGDGAPAAAGSTGAPAWPQVWMQQRLRLPLALRYGENPHQAAAAYRDDPAWGLARLCQRAGGELSYNNLLDTDAATALVRDLDPPACVLIKHANPCGAARGASAAAAFEAARACDPMSAYGGIAAFNVPVDDAAAQALSDLFLEVVCAPAVEPEALQRLAAKKKLRVLEVPLDGGPPLQERELHGLLLVQERDRGLEELGELELVTRCEPTAAERRDLGFLLAVCKHVRSNAIVVGKNERTLGIGAGQMSRVDSCDLAVRKAAAAGHDLSGSVAVSDAFFPFPDGVEVLGRAGVRAILQPGGSKRDPEVIAAADALGVAMLLSHRRHFRH